MQIKELGHIVLYVTDLEKLRHFYRDILGFKEIGSMNKATAFSSGRTHHELLLIEIGGEPKNDEISPGLYHIGFKIGDEIEDLKKAVKELENNGVEIIGFADHTVTKSIYI